VAPIHVTASLTLTGLNPLRLSMVLWTVTVWGWPIVTTGAEAQPGAGGDCGRHWLGALLVAEAAVIAGSAVAVTAVVEVPLVALVTGSLTPVVACAVWPPANSRRARTMAPTIPAKNVLMVRRLMAATPDEIDVCSILHQLLVTRIGRRRPGVVGYKYPPGARVKIVVATLSLGAVAELSPEHLISKMMDMGRRGLWGLKIHPRQVVEQNQRMGQG
jgi:hypothetical protein